MAGALMMDAKTADTLLDGIGEALSRFAREYGMRLAKNTHFEAINRELRWKDENREKVINIEYTYTDGPLFEVSVSVASVHRFGRGATTPMRHAVRDITLPVPNPEVEELLLDAKMQLDAI
ncbi:MAG: hypothetical protein HQ523_10380 [Lentisphaerae bacterium]|nr:hypothetical protein [Lentisphaerota bacterium]